MSSSPQPARSSRARAGREAEGTHRRARCAPACQHHVELVAARVQVQDTGGRVGDLRVGHRLPAPQSDDCCCLEISTPEHLAHEVLEAVPVRVGAGEVRDAILVQ